MSRSIKQTVSYIQKAIIECWESQKLLEEDSSEYKALDHQISAYQDVYKFLTDEEFDGEDEDDEVAVGTDQESEQLPGSVLKKQDEDPDESEDGDEDEAKRDH